MKFSTPKHYTHGNIFIIKYWSFVSRYFDRCWLNLGWYFFCNNFFFLWRLWFILRWEFIGLSRNGDIINWFIFDLLNLIVVVIWFCINYVIILRCDYVWYWRQFYWMLFLVKILFIKIISIRFFIFIWFIVFFIFVLFIVCFRNFYF